MKLFLIAFLFIIPLKLTSVTDYLPIDNTKYHQLLLDAEKQRVCYHLFTLITIIESSGNPAAHNLAEDAVGIAQIRPIMVKEVNQIVGYDKYSLEDRWCPDLSFQLFSDYMERFNPSLDYELGARIWNGGREGYKKSSTDIYWNKLKTLI